MSGEYVVKKIKKECQVRGISIYQLSKMTSIRQSTLNSLLHSASPNPKYETIVSLARGLKMTVKDFFNDDLFNQFD